ncbi:MAG TPA: T9SS type A sorting domain-containing protein [bacterium]|nr:T9SS type A sorting domain-containing protein [bacterium]HPN43986.1 T9SS type A sorting domain-containing protein [bacterium]
MKKNKQIILYHVLILIIIACFVFPDISPAAASGSIDFIFQPNDNITQFAIWVENAEGQYVGTAFLTNFIGRRGGGNRTASPDIDSGDGNRLNALPVWSYKRGVIDTTFGVINYYPPASNQPGYPNDIDAVSMATPNTSVQTITWQCPDLPGGTYTCRIEANKSFDFNEYHNYSFYRGQPSTIWEMNIPIANAPDSASTLDYVGYGSIDGSSGALHVPDSTITTADDLLQDMGGYRFKAVYTPGAVGIAENSRREIAPVSFSLAANYPNPFNNNSVIPFTLHRTETVQLNVYDALGHLVRSMQVRELGNYEIRFDAAELASGVYFYRLSGANGNTATGKMLLLR